MQFSEYQQLSRRTAIYPNAGANMTYPTLGLCGEAGEIAEKVKKVFRDQGGVFADDRKQEIKKELGDVLWYVSQIASELGLALDEVASANIEKLYSRMDRGVLSGSGDNR